MKDVRFEHAQHLLRHLHDPAALAENPLVEALGVTAVRDLLERVCKAMGDQAKGHTDGSPLVRRYEIFRRCDMRREAHGLVVNALGISRRQFYRERRIIARRVADAFTQLGLQRLVHDTKQSDRMHDSGEDAQSRTLDATLIRRLREARQCGGGSSPIVQYAAIRLARRELDRGYVRAAMEVLDLAGDSGE